MTLPEVMGTDPRSPEGNYRRQKVIENCDCRRMRSQWRVKVLTARLFAAFVGTGSNSGSIFGDSAHLTLDSW